MNSDNRLILFFADNQDSSVLLLNYLGNEYGDKLTNCVEIVNINNYDDGNHPEQIPSLVIMKGGIYVKTLINDEIIGYIVPYITSGDHNVPFHKQLENFTEFDPTSQIDTRTQTTDVTQDKQYRQMVDSLGKRMDRSQPITQNIPNTSNTQNVQDEQNDEPAMSVTGGMRLRGSGRVFNPLDMTAN